MLVCGHLHNMRLWINLFASFLLVLLLITPEIKFAELRTHSSHCYGHATLLYMGCSAYIKNSVSVMKWLNSTTYYLLLPAEIKKSNPLNCAYPLVTFNLTYQSMWFNFNSSTLLLFYCIALAIVLHAYTKGTTQDLISSPPIPYTIFFWPCYFMDKIIKENR